MSSNRRIPRARNIQGVDAAEQSTLTIDHLNPRYLHLDRGGRVTINLEQLKADLDIQPAAAPAAEIDVFEGAGSTGTVPDPITEASTFLKDDGTWTVPSGGGDVVGPASATDDNIATFDSTTGKLIQDGGSTIADISNATHTGDVTGSGALTVDPTAISGKTEVTAVGADHVLIHDATDSALKKALVSDFGGGSGDVVGPASAVDEHLVAFDGTTGKLIKSSGGTAAALLTLAGDVDGPASSVDDRIATFNGTGGKDIQDGGSTIADIANATHTGEVTGSGALSLDVTAITNQGSALPVEGDPFVFEQAGVLKKTNVVNLVTASDLGGDGGTFKQRTDLDLEFRGVSGTAADGVTVTEGTNENTISLDTGGVPLGKLEAVTGNAVVVEPASVPGSVTSVGLSSGYSIVGRKNASDAIQELSAASDNMVFMRGSGSAGTRNMLFRNMNRFIQSLLLDGTAVVGSTFPTTNGAPRDGWWFYRTDLQEWFVYNDTWNVWVGTDGFTLIGYGIPTQSNTPLALDLAGTTAFSSSRGFVAPYPCRPVWASAVAQDEPSTNVNFRVLDDGSALATGGVLTLTGSGGSGTTTATADFASNATVPTTIASGSVLGITQSTAQTDTVYLPIVQFHFRRTDS